MKPLLAIALLCPLAAAAADWRYDGQPAGESAAGETAAAESQAPAGSMGVSAGPAPADAPTNNMTMDEVRAAKGDPDSMFEPVGEPPITRWQYPDYVVYFEHDRVIISVAGHW